MVRILFASTLYLQHLRWFECQNPTLSELSFTKAMQLFSTEGCGWGENWRYGLEKMKKYQVFVAYYNWEHAQKIWARENGLRPNSETWMADILTAQIEAFKPDVLFINGWELGASYVEAIRQGFPFVKKVVGYDGIANCNPDVFRGTDIVLAPLKTTAEIYQAHGFMGHFFKRGFDATMLGLLEKRPQSIPASFVGSIRFQGRGHNERLRLLHHVSRRCSLQLFLSMEPARHLPRLVASNVIHRRVTSWRPLFSDIFAYCALARTHSPPVFGKKMFQTLADSAVSLNCHIDAAGESAGNMRLFEATGVGSCLLTDWKTNLHEFFDLDREIVTFHSMDECLDKLKYLIQNPQQRQAIAQAGQQRTLNDHNVETEIQRFGEKLLRVL